MSTGNKTQYFPILTGDTANPIGFWSEKDNNVLKVRGVKSSWNAASVTGINVDMEVDANDLRESTNQATAYDPTSGKYFSDHMYYRTRKFGMVSKLFTLSDQSQAQFPIDGPFVYTNNSPNHPAVALSSNGVFGVNYTTNTVFLQV